MTEPINTDLVLLIDSNLGDPSALYGALIERENAALDTLRAIAATVGLRPSMVNLMMSQANLGTPMTEEVHELLHRQAEVEQAELQAQWEDMQRRLGEQG